MSETTTIQISKHVWNQLDDIKKENGHTSFDSVVRHVLSLAEKSPCKGEKCIWYWNCMSYGCQMFMERTEKSERAHGLQGDILPFEKVKRQVQCSNGCGESVEIEVIPGVYSYDLVFCSEKCRIEFWERDKKLREERGLPPRKLKEV